MDYQSLARGLGIYDMPTYINCWPEKEIHRLATYKKLLFRMPDGDQQENLKETIKVFVQEQEERARDIANI